jgi:hypothetical protein
MKKDTKLRLLYWIPTVQIVLVMAVGGTLNALRTESALQVFRHLGYPDYFAMILGTAQLLGVIALLAPVPRRLREWAYAGFTFDVCGAILSIISAGDPVFQAAIPLYALVMIQLSFYAWRKREEGGTSSAPLAAPLPQAA